MILNAISHWDIFVRRFLLKRNVCGIVSAIDDGVFMYWTIKAIA